ncbi:hypothetical protein [Streptomyces nitrosporeus]|uniref:hypothetical protein n=1 Tax=Streptomyces nitrosporeus TaxID=28894 RepID=UPI00167DCF4D|nr:hypothetical protein [Streptomyces nitrosporeus]
MVGLEIDQFPQASPESLAELCTLTATRWTKINISAEHGLPDTDPEVQKFV